MTDITPDSDEPNIVAELIEATRQRLGDRRVATGERLVGLTAFAREMGVSVQAVQKWYDQNEVPPRRVPRAAEVSGIPRHRIRREGPLVEDEPGPSSVSMGAA